MSMDYPNPNPAGGSNNGDRPLTDAPLINATPIWETRGKKKRGLGRSVAPLAATAPTGAYADPGFTSPETSIATSATEDLNAPIGRPRTATTTARKEGIAPAAIVLGVLALAGVGAAGWYASNRTDDRVAELTPGVVTTAPAAAPLASRTEPTLPSEPARASVTVRSSDRAAPVRTARVAPRVRPARSAADAGVNAGVTIPAAPQPYETVNPAAAPVPAPPPVDTAVNPVPAPIPATPPVQTPDPVEPTPQEVTPPTP